MTPHEEAEHFQSRYLQAAQVAEEAIKKNARLTADNARLQQRVAELERERTKFTHLAGELAQCLHDLIGKREESLRLADELHKARTQIASMRLELAEDAVTKSELTAERDALRDENARLREQLGNTQTQETN